jgi:pimeloyl-ACP methyl ester carboxylesterase
MQVTGLRQPHHIQVAGCELELFEEGSGPPLLLLHSGEGVESASPLVHELSSAFRVLAPSHPGFGATELPPHITSTDDIAYLYLDLIEKLQLRDVVLVGASFGGWLAAEIATKSSQQLSQLVLIDPVGIKVSGREQRDILDIFAVPAHEVARATFHDASLRERDHASLSDDQRLRIARNRESLLAFTWSPYMHNPKLKARLHRVSVPTLLLWGERDGIVSPEYGRQYASLLPQSQFRLIKGAGHHPEQEQPRPVARAILEFVNARQSEASTAIA